MEAVEPATVGNTAEPAPAAKLEPVPEPAKYEEVKQEKECTIGAPSTDEATPTEEIHADHVPSCFERFVIGNATMVYWVLLFLAHWFLGESALDVDGDGKFDMEDVDVVLVRWGLIKLNYARLEKEKIAARRAKTKDLDSLQKSLRKESLDASMGEAPHLTDFAARMGLELDRNHDGHVDILDLLESDVEGGEEGMDDELIEDLKKGRVKPYFVAFQCLVCFGFWIVFAILGALEGKGEVYTLKGGLDSVNDDGMFTLRIRGQDCEDYRHEAWRWILYQYTHIGALHVVMNCLLVVILGVPLEGEHGTFRLLCMFQAGVVGGALCYFVGDGRAATVGMSGGCYALVGIAFADLIMNWKQKHFRKPTLVFLLVLVAADLTAYSFSLGSESSSHTAHFGGFIAGLLGGIELVRNKKVEKCEKILKIINAIVIVLLIAFCLGWLFLQWPVENIWEKLDPSNKDPLCWTRLVWDPAINVDSYVCVQCSCGDEACKSQWSSGDYVRSVSEKSCGAKYEWHTRC